MKRLVCKLKPYIQPFERVLAFNELRALTGETPKIVFGSDARCPEFEIYTTVPVEVLVQRLAYWEAIAYDKKQQYTEQVLFEATMNVARNGITPQQIEQIVPFRHTPPLPKKRSLRYGTHGIHEYRGKFFPQLVRSLINFEQVEARGIIADPMSGSGTTVVEAVMLGCHGIGLDMNPLSVFIAKTKAALLAVEPQELETAYQEVRDRINAPRSTQRESRIYFNTLPEEDRDYLEDWLSEQVLNALDWIITRIKLVEHPTARDLMLLSLSNIIRKVSWQKEDDLRVRREVVDDKYIDPVGDFLSEMGRSVKTVLAFLYQRDSSTLGTFCVNEGDARDADRAWADYIGEVDTVITSPPYATALPYLDTDRLSLCYLGLLPRPEHRQRDQHMIGNREVTDKWRLAYWQDFQERKADLPSSVVQLIERVDTLNSGTDIGFRRRNLPALLSRYFFDMRRVLVSISNLLRPGASAFVVVGNNHTIAGGERVEIRTADLLADIARTIGFDLAEQIDMEMLISRDIFKKNAMNSEVILHLLRP
ncbi:hypothetical protein [Candidatus Chloroploca asiatica]|uniref:DNA methylase N-4/N-6 domain-containing protein n=1 Tax=Candidatus Chloroploca asiatica TaxID=1506545 RepID=A0A2H3LEK1_9CHLR|nr:hypothetical protein [Candidatus Chloroploca asiatica]PDW01144.1 hypothetical protein A9Q02_21250 [Candidatus Chloroploca asiatica]